MTPTATAATTALAADDRPVPYVLADRVTMIRLNRDALVAQLRITLPPDHLSVLADALDHYADHLANAQNAALRAFEPDHLLAKRHAHQRRIDIIAGLVERALGRKPR